MVWYGTWCLESSHAVATLFNGDHVLDLVGAPLLENVLPRMLQVLNYASLRIYGLVVRDWTGTSLCPEGEGGRPLTSTCPGSMYVHLTVLH